MLCVVCREQDNLKLKLRVEDGDEARSWEEDTLPFAHLSIVAGVDISFEKEQPNHACAMLSVLSYPQLKVQLQNWCSSHVAPLIYNVHAQLHGSIWVILHAKPPFHVKQKAYILCSYYEYVYLLWSRFLTGIMVVRKFVYMYLKIQCAYVHVCTCTQTVLSIGNHWTASCEWCAGTACESLSGGNDRAIPARIPGLQRGGFPAGQTEGDRKETSTILPTGNMYKWWVHI